MTERDRGYVSGANSTAEPLAAGATWTGSWENQRSYNSVVVAAKTDQNGVFAVQFSPDGHNIDSSLTRYYQADGRIEAPHRFTMTRRYFRVTFTNTSGSDQSFLRLQTMLKDAAPLNAPADSVLAQDFDATVVRPSDFKTEVALGLRQGYILWNKWGYNTDVDAAADETIWSPGGLFAPMTSADTLNLVSSTANDDKDSGTGAQSVTIYGVDANFLAQEETIELEGLTPVTTVNTWRGVNRISIATVGTGGTNDGTITVTTTGGSNTVQADMPAGTGSTQQLIFHVQAGHRALADWLWINALKIGVGTEPIVTIKGFYRSWASGSIAEVFHGDIDTAVDNIMELRPPSPFVLPGPGVFELRADTDTDNTVIRARMSLIEARLVGF